MLLISFTVKAARQHGIAQISEGVLCQEGAGGSIRGIQADLSPPRLLWYVSEMKGDAKKMEI